MVVKNGDLQKVKHRLKQTKDIHVFPKDPITFSDDDWGV